MAEKNFCSRETVLNYLMDRHRITYEEIEKKTGKGDTKELMQMVNDCMVFFVESDIPFEDRVEWVLDRMCRFLEAEASYFVLYGRSRSIYASSVLRNDEKAKPKSEEFSLLLNTRLKNSFKPGRFCFLEDLKKVKYDDREVYKIFRA